MRQALLIVFVIVVLMVLKKIRARRGKPGRTARPERTPERMVECAFCGIHIPVSESLQKQERYYCCEQHEASDG